MADVKGGKTGVYESEWERQTDVVQKRGTGETKKTKREEGGWDG